MLDWNHILQLALPAVSYLAAFLIHRPKKLKPPPLPPSMKQR